MEKEILNMFNKINVSDYLISNPYTSACNKVFKRIFKSEDFLKLFYFMSNKTYERLASIAYVAEDATKNTIFITGFRGCGKTCFMNLLDSIVNDRFEIPDYSLCLQQEIVLLEKMYQEQKMEDSKEEIRKIIQNYSDSANIILQELRANLDMDAYELNEKSFAPYLMKALNGNTIFLNFNQGDSSGKEFPFNQKFIKKIDAIIDTIIKENYSIGKGNSKNPFYILYDFYERNSNVFNETFEDNNILFEFFEFSKDRLAKIEHINTEKKILDDILAKMNLEQLLCVLVFLHFARNITNREDGKLFFLLDNMDIIYHNNVLDQSMYEYANFIEGMNTIMDRINAAEEIAWTQKYDNTTFIFAMRETTSMQIADQFYDDVDYVAKYFDISLDTDKAFVVEKKYTYVDSYRDGIKNDIFVKNIDYVHKICTDVYVKNNIFPMFNNDFKRAMFCITKICSENYNLIDEKLDLLDTQKAYNKNGARGILFRVIYNEFMRRRYFEKIGIDWPVSHNKTFTSSRIILTILYNLLPEYNQQDVVYPETISIHRLYSLASALMNKETFINSLLGMYSLKNAQTWNHLITFDNIKSVTYDELERVLDSGKNTERIDVAIRITCAGTNYVKFICTHFEFFSCRFTNRTQPLFCKKNCQFSEKYNNYNFEYILDRVYKSVANCCEKLAIINKQLEIWQERHEGSPLMESEYVFKEKHERIGRLHEERIIHRHITYIDNYRMHLINNVYVDKVQEINKKIIDYIEKYIALLNNIKYGDMSKVLFKELGECVRYIKEEKEYNDTRLEISRDGYSKLEEEGYIR